MLRLQYLGMEGRISARNLGKEQADYCTFGEGISRERMKQLRYHSDLVLIFRVEEDSAKRRLGEAKDNSATSHQREELVESGLHDSLFPEAVSCCKRTIARRGRTVLNHSKTRSLSIVTLGQHKEVRLSMTRARFQLIEVM